MNPYAKVSNMHTLYRVDNPNGQGLWYKSNGEFDPHIYTMPNAKCRHLPMAHDEDLVGGWISATDNLSDLLQWVSVKDALELQEAGYDLQEIKVTEYRIAERYPHAVFQERAVISKKRLELDTLLYI